MEELKDLAIYQEVIVGGYFNKINLQELKKLKVEESVFNMEIDQDLKVHTCG